MPMTPEMGPRRPQAQSPEDRIRALMMGLGGEVAGAAGAAGDFIQKMPLTPGSFPSGGPILEKLPYIPGEQTPGRDYKRMPLKTASPYMHKTVPRDIRID